MDTLKNALKLARDKEEEKSENAIDLLKQDHHKVRKIFSDLESAGAKKKQVLIRHLITELEIHSKIEEMLIYPLLEDRAPEQIGEALEEHHVVQLLLDELKSKSPSRIDAKITVLKEMVLHHIKEEEGELLPRLAVGDEDLDDLGADIKDAKEALTKEMEKPARPAARKTTTKKPPAATRRTATRAGTRKAGATTRKAGASARKSTASTSARRATTSANSGRTKAATRRTKKSPVATKGTTRARKATTSRAGKTGAGKTVKNSRGRAKSTTRRTSK